MNALHLHLHLHHITSLFTPCRSHLTGGAIFFIQCPSSINPKERPHSALPRRKWDSNAEEPSRTGRFGFGLHDGADYGDDGFAFGGGSKQRVWWSDYDEDEDDDDDDLELDDGEELWGFKLLKAFGWLLPAIGISLVLGTGSNAFLMALAVPLGQKFLSFAFEKVWGMTNESDSWKPRTRSKTKKKPFTRPRNDTRESKKKQESDPTNGRNSYQSWVGTDGSYGRRNKNETTFGGWDDLDEKAGTYEIPRKQGAASQKTYAPSKRHKKGKFSTIGRVRETPLLLRLVIAAFPFLGFWTKLLF